jgi:hypothetical protein
MERVRMNYKIHAILAVYSLDYFIYAKLQNSLVCWFRICRGS